MSQPYYTKIKSKELSIEFWVVTAFITLAFIFSILGQILMPVNSTLSQGQTVNGVLQYGFVLMGERFIPILFNHLVVYIAYLILHFHVEPELSKTDDQRKNILPVYALIFLSIVFGIINIYWAALLGLKLLFILLSSNTKSPTHTLERESGFLLSSWILVIASAYLLDVHLAIKIYGVLALPSIMLLYLYAIRVIIPAVFDRKWKFSAYFFKLLSWNIFTSLLLVLLVLSCSSYAGGHQYGNIVTSGMNSISIKYLLLARRNEDLMFVAGLGNFLTTLIIITPLAWQTYKRRNQLKNEEITSLKTELGKSDANLNFLKSQINPHFLFNALNTLYGTALQENAERTGEGIQKLGDMMRFMLQENMEDKILLTKDIDYLNNYIALQKLRTSTTNGIIIETQIDSFAGNLLITPMLLIPFVENAFKHGISLNNPSHIKVTLQVEQQKIYFDVHNSLHTKSEEDPERLHSGIGLQNVKQRLSLLYPNQHELIIRKTAKEFFIHLTLDLSENS